MKYILGGGLAGLLMLEIMGEDYILLTDKIGGQMATEFPLGPRILHHSDKVEQFLNTIGIKKEPRIFKVGYHANGCLHDTATEEQKLQYFIKTRGHSQANKSALSEGKNYYAGWDMNDINLIDVLYERNMHKIQYINIKSLDPINQYINNSLKYTKLISTIPLEVLQTLIHGTSYLSNLKRDVYFHYVKRPTNYFEDYDYIYVIGGSYINRYTKISDDEQVVEASKQLNFLPGLVKCIKAKTQIVTELKWDSLYGIELVGRFAQFDHSVKANNIIEKYW